jgi:hypothetical protein
MLIEYVKNGRRRKVNAAVAKLLIGKNLAREVSDDGAAAATTAESVATYDTRMLQADTSEAAPYGYKADGTPRKRPAPQRTTKDQD